MAHLMRGDLFISEGAVFCACITLLLFALLGSNKGVKHNESLTAATINRDVKINYIIFQTQYSLFLYMCVCSAVVEKSVGGAVEYFLLW
jgi:hypothetical protein